VRFSEEESLVGDSLVDNKRACTLVLLGCVSLNSSVFHEISRCLSSSIDLGDVLDGVLLGLDFD